VLDRGYLTLARIRGVPVRVHWTMPLGALMFGGLAFAPAFWLAFFVLVLSHEFGHAALAWRARQRVISIDVTGFGGVCRWAGLPSAYDRALIAWGGVLAQAGLLVVAVVLAATTRLGASRWGVELISALTGTNLLLMLINLVPIPPLDGAEAWRLLPQLLDRWRGRRVLRGAGVALPPRTRAQEDAALAAFLKQVSEEARRARRGGPS
jgi:stage IV sporulation protein FB